jgi:hypothetical protein
VLHVERRVDALAAWSQAGWKPLLADMALTHLIYFALTELGPASDAQDIGAVQDLSAELGALLDLVILQPAEDQQEDDRQAQLRSIALRLWGDLQYAIGRRHWADIALNAAVLRRLAGPEPPTRPTDAVPTYRSLPDRVPPTGQLPLIERANSTRDSVDAGTRFLERVASALIAGAGHLVDPETADVPHNAIPARVGWPAARGAPTGERIGSLRPAGAAGVLMTLDPAAAVAAANRAGELSNDANTLEPLTEQAVAEALARAWILDTTLTISTAGVARRPAVQVSVLDGGAESWLWQVPVSVWHPRQFYAGQRDQRPADRPLRVVRDQRS